ncbi:hypothetical protein KO465_03710 [Candidatus Micrarchaeota archaeon]|nr:hypothetical protein [Candidatus Micrarchaeota archaeon]
MEKRIGIREDKNVGKKDNEKKQKINLKDELTEGIPDIKFINEVFRIVEANRHFMLNPALKKLVVDFLKQQLENDQRDLFFELNILNLYIKRLGNSVGSMFEYQVFGEKGEEYHFNLDFILSYSSALQEVLYNANLPKNFDFNDVENIVVDMFSRIQKRELTEMDFETYYSSFFKFYCFRFNDEKSTKLKLNIVREIYSSYKDSPIPAAEGFLTLEYDLILSNVLQSLPEDVIKSELDFLKELSVWTFLPKKSLYDLVSMLLPLIDDIEYWDNLLFSLSNDGAIQKADYAPYDLSYATFQNIKTKITKSEFDKILDSIESGSKYAPNTKHIFYEAIKPNEALIYFEKLINLIITRNIYDREIIDIVRDLYYFNLQKNPVHYLGDSFVQSVKTLQTSSLFDGIEISGGNFKDVLSRKITGD